MLKNYCILIASWRRNITLKGNFYNKDKIDRVTLFEIKNHLVYNPQKKVDYRMTIVAKIYVICYHRIIYKQKKNKINYPLRP